MWWKDMFWGFWNGMTAWFVLIAHAFGKLERQPIFDTRRRGNWYAFGFLIGVAALSGPRKTKLEAGKRRVVMSKWLLVFILLVQAHFAASYLVPLREEDESAMGGILRWAWPWADGDNGPLGTLVAEGENPLAGIFLGLGAASLLILAAMSVAGWWVPVGWWRPLATAGAGLLVVLMALFFGPTKIIPIAFALGTLYVTLARPGTFNVD